MPRPILLRILIGAGLWALLLFAPTITVIPRVILLAVLVVVPLALWLINGDNMKASSRYNHAASVLFHALAAIMTVIAFLLPTGNVAGGLTLGWLVFTAFVAWRGLLHLRTHRLTSAAEMCLSVGRLYLPIGGVWLVASRLGISLLGFGEPIVALTAAHFHYAGFAALVIAGLTGRFLELRPNRPRVPFRLIAIGLTVGMMLVAAGITFSPLLEVVAAVVFAASLAGLALLQLRYVVPHLSRRLPQILLGLSALMVLWAMGAAVLYAVGEYTHSTFFTIPQMLRVHGEVNALGFVLLNLVGWALISESK